MPLVFYDRFTGTNGTLLDAHTPDFGTSWTKLINVGTGGVGISSNQADADVGGYGLNDGGFYSADGTYSSADYEVRLVYSGSDTGDDTVIMALRVQDASNMYALRFSTDVFELYKCVSGTWSVIGTDVGAVAAANDTIRIVASGTSIKTYTNETLRHDITDSSHSSAGKAGLGFGAVVVSSDDSSNQAVDNFEVGYGMWVDPATTTTFATSVTSMAANLPSNIISGDLLLAWASVRNAGTWTVPTNWTELDSQSSGGVGELTFFYKEADGTEGATATWTAGTGTTAAWHTRKVVGWDGTTAPEVAKSTNGGGAATNTDPPNLAPSWGSDDNLFIAIAQLSAEAITYTAAPTNYDQFTNTSASSGGSVADIATAIRHLTASSDNPGVFTDSADARWWDAMTVGVKPASVVAAVVTGTMVPSVTESDIVAGGKTIIITLTGDTWIAAGAASFDLQRDEIIAGLDSAQSELLGWNTVVQALQTTTGVVRTSDTVVTITLDAQATYNITATETITVTVPGTAVTGGNDIVATPTFQVTPVVTEKIRDIIGTGVVPFAR
jgi:hypothetical protein